MQRILIVYLVTSAVIITVAAIVVTVIYTTGLLGKHVSTVPSGGAGRHSGHTGDSGDHTGTGEHSGDHTGAGDHGRTPRPDNISQEALDAIAITNAMRDQQKLGHVSHDAKLAARAEHGLSGWLKMRSSVIP